MKDDVTQYEVECSSDEHISRLLVNNQTFMARMDGLLPATSYNCCVSAVVLNGHKPKSCSSIKTSQSNQQGTARGDASAVGGVLGFLVIILLLLLALTLIALVYPCLIRPGAQKSKIHVVSR